MGKEGYKILLVDDDPDDRDLFEEAASYLDPPASIIAFRDGVALMQYLSESPPAFDMIFLDLNMPKKNGKECLLEIYAQPRFKNVPVIIYTTSLNPTDIEGTFQAGAYRFFKKPNSFDELKNVLLIAFHTALDKNAARTRENFVLAHKDSAAD